MPNLQGLVNACNRYEGGEGIPADWAYLCLPDENKRLRIFGILQKNAFDAITWVEHGFKVVATVEKAKSLEVDISKHITTGRFVIPDGLEPKGVTQKLRDINLTKPAGLPALKGADDKDRVPLVAGHPDVCFPDKLGASLGITQIGVHLTVYRGDGEDLTACVQERSHKASYPDMFDQTAAGGLQYGESVREGLRRETKEEVRKVITNPAYDGAVVFSTLRPAEAGKLAGTIEISAKACYSMKVAETWAAPTEIKDPKVKGFRWMTVQDILDNLKENKFKPNCALVMIKFLIERGVIDKSHDGYENLRESLEASIPFLLPENLDEYETRGS